MRLSIRLKLTGTYAIVMIALVMMSGYAIHTTKAIFIREIGQSSVLVAQEVFKRMDQRLYHFMNELQIHTMGHPFQQELGVSNAAFEAMGDRADYVNREASLWNDGDRSVLKKDVLNSHSSEHLRELYYTNFERRYGYSLVENVILTNRYGAVVIMVTGETPYDHGEALWWKTVRESGSFVGNIHRNRTTGKTGIDLAVAVTDERGRFAGGLLLRLNIRQLIREAEVGVRKYHSTRIQIVTEDGRLLYATSPHRYLEDVSMSEVYPYLAEEEGFVVTKKGEPRIYSFTHSRGFKFFEGLNWNLVISHRLDDVLASYRSLQVSLIVFTMIMASLTLALVILLAARVTSPLRELMEGIQTLGEGGYGSPVKVRSRDEFGDLARAFNEMMERRRRMEADLHFAGFAMDHASDAALWVSPDGMITYVNEALCDSLGYGRRDLLGAHIETVDQGVSREVWSDYWNELKSRGHLTVERAFETNDGRSLPVEVVVNHMEFRGREYLCAFARDISERKRNEDERLQMERRLRQAQKMEAIGTLAGGIAHDFNNILSVILGYADMAREDLPRGAPALDDIREVLKAGNRARDLVAQILAFSRQSETEHIPFQPASIIKEGVKMLRASLPSTIIIKENINPECGVIVSDPTQMNQVLINLCTNAFHAMEKEGGILTVELKNETVDKKAIEPGSELQPGRYVKLTVQDSGPGIPDAIQERIFEPYFTTKEVGRGTGMGLAIVHGIMKSCGGFITLESRVGQGATFRLYFPASREAAFPALDDGVDVPGGSERILFVDDEPYLAEMGQEMLERLGYQVTVARESIKAWELFEKDPEAFDLVITDQTMPEMTGAALSEYILRLRPGFPIILCTGYSSLISEEKAKSMGIREFALKPLVKRDIAYLIRKVLGTP
ncbi:hypothetical protein DSLASN_08460 [Desulfoluna limicola]|uniref:histidine kinase n=1 Tax=Desulfoluna limicola TaxID=2810562 RepID=A0ABM7PDG6_9BACT|nr:ATP-binding protein [Desulfoluna limicola]BCS95214.1 hypothetical protein DSLASN_08460 [Desulfoluna limicola]